MERPVAESQIPQALACTKCGVVQPLENFGVKRTSATGRVSQCKACDRARARAWHSSNKDRANARARAWKAANPERVKDLNRRNYAANKEDNRARFNDWAAVNAARRREYMRAWYAANPGKHSQYGTARATPQHRLENAIRCRIWSGITRGSKRGRRTFEWLGYSIDDLMTHLERQFERGMSWDNYGEWHIDHVLPLSSFSYSQPSDPEFRAAWSLPNLRPLWGKQNASKGAKRLTLL